MKITQFLKEKIPVMISAAVFLAAVRLLGYAFKAQGEYMMALVILLLVLMTVNLVMEFMKKRSFYNDFLGKLEQLDRKYLITEMTGQPEFLEGEILCESLYEIDKSMKERINDIEDTQREFREYVEMWIHEIKVPIATLSCMNFNGTKDLQKQKQQIDKLDYYVEQIVNNSVKYLVCKENHKKENVHIRFYTKEDADTIQLMIEDNGIGSIAAIDRVTSGHIYVGGQDITALKKNALNQFRRDELGFIFQDFNLLDTLTAHENIALALSIQNVPSAYYNVTSNATELATTGDVMLFITICVLSSALSVNKAINDNLKTMVPVDVNFYHYSGGEGMGEMPHIADVFRMAGIDETMFRDAVDIYSYNSEKLTLKDTLGEYALEAAGENASTLAYFNDAWEEVLYVSDYNRVARLYGQKQFQLVIFF